MPRRGIGYALLVTLTVGTSAVVGLYFRDTPMSSGRKLVMPASTKAYTLLIATSEAEQRQGLGGRASLPQNQGMLFANDTVGERCFWMRDMQFPLDIVWVGADKRIVALEREVSPRTYPQTYCADAQYVIELNAGVAAKNNLHVGQRVSF